jgi:hypothetical protein
MPLVLLYEPDLVIHRTCSVEMLHPHTDSGRVYAEPQSVILGSRYYGCGSDMGLCWRCGIRSGLYSGKHRTKTRRGVLY